MLNPFGVLIGSIFASTGEVQATTILAAVSILSHVCFAQALHSYVLHHFLCSRFDGIMDRGTGMLPCDASLSHFQCIHGASVVHFDSMLKLSAFISNPCCNYFGLMLGVSKY